MRAKPKWGMRLGCLSKFMHSDLGTIHNLYNCVCVDHVGDTALTQTRQRVFIDEATCNCDLFDERKRAVERPVSRFS